MLLLLRHYTYRRKEHIIIMSTQTAENNKRIAKNTLYLYLRMSVFLFLGLFTARVTINTLDYSSS